MPGLPAGWCCWGSMHVLLLLMLLLRLLLLLLV
jgi:hypothetical protein